MPRWWPPWRMDLVNRKKWAIGYAVLCILYFVISAAVPHDQLESRGLEGIGKPSLKLKTEEITDGTELRFAYQSDAQPLSQLSFYFTADGKNLTEGGIQIEAYDAQTEELLAAETYELADLGVEAFWGVTFAQEPAGRELELVVTGKDVEDGPYIWLNTESQTAGSSYQDGTALEQNLIYNAVYRTQVHHVKQPLLVTAMLAVLGGMFFLVSGRRDALLSGAGKADGAREGRGLAQEAGGGALRGAGRRLQTFYQKYRKLLGLGLLLLIVALVFYYVYDVQIRKAMNSTHREVVMRDNGELLPVTADSRELVQYYTTEEDELVGLGVRMDLSEDFAGEGVVHAEVRDVTEERLLCAADIDASTLLDGQYMGLIFDSSQSGIKGHTYEIRLEFSEELLDSGLSVIVTPAGYYQENALYVNGEESENRLSMNAHTYFNLFLKKYFFGMFIFAELMAAGFYYLAFLRRCRIEKVFVFTILCLGVIYNFTLTPYMTPDESYHIDMCYRHSNTLLGIESAGENKCFKREADTQLEFTSNPSLENYKNIYDGLFSVVKEDTLVEADATSTTEAPMIIYLPAVVGMTLARLLHLGTVPMLLLGRWFSLLGFTALTYFAMKKLPFGKSTLFLLAILPMGWAAYVATSLVFRLVATGVPARMRRGGRYWEGLRAFTLRQVEGHVSTGCQALSCTCVLVACAVCMICAGLLFSVGQRSAGLADPGALSEASLAPIGYVGIFYGEAFLVAAAAVIALQQVSQAADGRRAYATLVALGADARETRGAVRAQVGVAFVLPAALAVVHDVFGLMLVRQLARGVPDEAFLAIAACSVVGTLGLLALYYLLCVRECSRVLCCQSDYNVV